MNRAWCTIFCLISSLWGAGCATSLGGTSFQAGDAVLCQGTCEMEISDEKTTLKGDIVKWTGPMSRVAGQAWDTAVEAAPEIVGAVVGGNVAGPAGAVGGAALGNVVKEAFDDSSNVEVCEP